MLFRDISIITENMDVRHHVDVIVKGDRIERIANTGACNENQDHEDNDIIDGSRFLMMPAFYNAHGHSPMSLMRGYGDNLSLQDWLFTKIFPFEDKLTDEAVYYGTLLSMAESFKYGIASTSDMYYFLDAIVSAVGESGGKVNVSRAIVNPEGLPFMELPSVNEMIEAVNKYNGAHDGRIIVDGSLHAEYTSDEPTAKGLAELTKELELRMHVHVSETSLEHEECKVRHEGRTPVRYLADAGIFDVPSVAAHCVWISDEDIEVLKEKNVTVATNPVSNLKLASGICPVKKIMDAGVSVAVGTDSTSSNNNLSMFEEMKTLMLMAKLKENNPCAILPSDTLLMATRNGALAQGRNDAGYIKEGYKADIVLLKKDSPNLNPVHDLIGNIVMAATDSDIYMTVIDGKVVYKNGEYPTLDIDHIIMGVEKSVKDIINRL